MTPEPEKEYDKVWKVHGSILHKVMKALRDSGNRNLANELESDSILNCSRPYTLGDERCKVSWTEEDVVKEISDAFDRGYNACIDTIYNDLKNKGWSEYSVFMQALKAELREQQGEQG